MKSAMMLTVVIFCAMVLTASSQAVTIAEIDRIDPGRLSSVGFELTSTAEVDIEAIGVRQRQGKNMLAYAWLFNRDKREPVWVMKGMRTDKVGRKSGLRRAEKVKALEPGKYVLYYYAGKDYYAGFYFDGSKNIIDLLGNLFDYDEDSDFENDDDYDDGYGSYNKYEKMLDKCFVKITSDDISGNKIRPFDPKEQSTDALISENRLGDNSHIRRAFELKKPQKLRIYAQIEHPRGYRQPVDYGWITDMETREKVWTIDRWSTERAGGGSKNRKYDDEIELDKGKYVLHWVTDDSHSWREFNVRPPYDPSAWGVEIYPGENFDPSSFAIVEMPEDSRPVIDLARIRDDEYVEQGFRLKKDAELRILALGEYTSSSGFSDYGYIKDMKSGKTVWEMTKRNTEYAGGARKNRMFDGIISLPEGEYLASYMTDGSHSYRNWNSAQPYEPSAWGLSIYPANSSEADLISLADAEDLRNAGNNMLVSITRVRDDRRIHRSFSLDKDGSVRIYALGEGQGRRMYDYAWIEDKNTGRTVWEMTMRNTDHAGGASKNRVFDDLISLEAGDYEVYYESDGSHSFGDWNAQRPRDPESWGVSISYSSDSRADR